VLSDPATVPQIVPLISRFANSQNKVNAADFSANGKFHQQLEELSRTVWAPATSGLERGTHWYYERARGSYADDKSNAGRGVAGRVWVENNPPEQKFTKSELRELRPNGNRRIRSDSLRQLVGLLSAAYELNRSA